jgi:hypothetical protein
MRRFTHESDLSVIDFPSSEGSMRVIFPDYLSRDAHLVEVKAWVVRHHRYPGRKTSAETSMYHWLYHNLPGGQSHTPARWKKLNDAFGEGWEADFTSRRLSTPSALHRR